MSAAKTRTYCGLGSQQLERQDSEAASIHLPTSTLCIPFLKVTKCGWFLHILIEVLHIGVGVGFLVVWFGLLLA